MTVTVKLRFRGSPVLTLAEKFCMAFVFNATVIQKCPSSF